MSDKINNNNQIKYYSRKQIAKKLKSRKNDEFIFKNKLKYTFA